MCLFAGLAQPLAAVAQRVVYAGATVITATGADPIPDGAVVTERDRIVFVGTRADAPISAGDTIVDCGGQWIIPGLIDTNVHLVLMTVPEFFVKYEDDFEDIAIQSAQVGLKYGLTTMIDTWGPLEPLLAAKERINSEEVVGSRVLVAGNIVGLGGPYTPYFMGSWDARGLSLRYGGWVHPEIRQRINALWEADVGPGLMALTPGELKDAMLAYLERGVDVLKVAVSGHGLEPVEPLMFSREQLAAMRAAATEKGVPFTTHTFSIESLRMAVELDPDILLHPNVMNPSWNAATESQRAAIQELIDTIEKKQLVSGLMAIPEESKMEVYANWDPSQNRDDPWLNEVMTHRKAWFEGATYDDLAVSVRKWLAADIPYTIATDQGPDTEDLGDVVWGRMGRAHFDRMVGLQDAGEEPMDILIAATANGARAYNLHEDVGTIEAGKIADLVILDADPLTDIANVRRIHAVVLKGSRVDRAVLPTVKVLNYDPEAEWPR